jgi:hypothetical protein
VVKAPVASSSLITVVSLVISGLTFRIDDEVAERRFVCFALRQCGVGEIEVM